jgi:hypothetical protein
MRIRLAAVLAFVVSAVGAASANDLEGRYRIQGVEPDGRAYEGSLAVKKSGEIYVVMWSVGGRRYLGTALGAPSGFAVSFKFGDSTGVGIYRPTNDGYEGAYAYHLHGKAGQERWIRQEQPQDRRHNP